MCLFTTFGIGLPEIAAQYREAVGTKETDEEILQKGERIWNLEKKFNIAAGVEKDTLPPRLLNEALPSGAAKGKVAELALGYQGGVNALIAMGALDMGLKEEELLGLVKAWRTSNSNIVRYWHDVEKAAKDAVEKKMPSSVGDVKFYFENGIRFITLPSGRRLSYIKPRIEKDLRTNRECLTYEGLEQSSRQWVRISTYGGKLTENIVQAAARDCLAEAMLKLDKAGYRIVMHVHDEIVIDAPNGFGTVEEVLSIMGQTISWAKGLKLKAEGFEAQFYRKD
jgi:DNA polymerase